MQQNSDIKTTLDIEDCRLISKIGQGGIAEIYKARQLSLDRFVAVKILFGELTRDPDIVRRFELEATTIARLNHPNIVHVIAKGKTAGRYYFVMDYVDGTSFDDIACSERWSLKQKLSVFIQALKGLDYAHKNGVIHRDVKPANILVDKNWHAYVADFGIACLADRNELDKTDTDIVMGTVAYMAPEQKISAAGVDHTADIYSMGVILYEILTGQRPCGRFRLPSEMNSEIPRQYDDIVARCLAPDPRDRYQRAVEIKDTILDIIAAPTPAAPPAGREPSGVASLIGRSRFLDHLKETRYSTTMLVENRDTRELFVIKKNSKSPRGFREARILAAHKHDNIIDIYGAGAGDKNLVVVMEYASGGSLAERLARPYTPTAALEIVLAIAGALAFAARHGLIHGNLRPSNVLFDSHDKIRVTDFGLPSHYSLTDKNWYAPPEKKTGKSGDVYSLGVIFHQLLFGKNPAYDRGNRLFLGKARHTVPETIFDMLSRMLAIRVDQRYRSVDEFLTGARPVLDELTGIDRPSRPPRAVDQPPRNSRSLTIIVGLLLLAAVITALLLFADVL